MNDGKTQTLPVRSNQVVEAEFGAAERALLHLDTSRYHVLNPIGARIWDLLNSAATLDELCAALCAEYVVTPEACRREVETYLDLLLAEGLVVPAS